MLDAFGSAACAILGHKRDSTRAWYDGVDFRAPCKRCGQPMIKDTLQGRWRPFDTATDFNQSRNPRPEHRGTHRH